MPRKPRREEPNLIHHACLHGVADEFIFRSVEDRIAFSLMLAATTVRFRWLCLAYCQMGTHVHLLIETPEANLGAGIQWLAGRYGQSFNKQHRRQGGHLFGGRYYDEPVDTDAHLLNAVAYIAVNPCDAGIVDDPREWKWSSHSRVMSGTAPRWLAHDHLLGRLDMAAGSGSYEAIVERRRLRLIDTPREKGSDPFEVRRAIRSLIDTPREKGSDPLAA